MFNSRRKYKEEKRLKSEINNYRLSLSHGFLSRHINRLALNKPLQFVIVVASFLLLTIYILIGFYDISGVWYDVRKNTTLIKSEHSLTEITSLVVKDDGETVIETESGETITRQKVGYVFIDGDEYGQGSRYFLPKDNIVVSPIGEDFLKNYIIGTKLLIVVTYLLLFEGLRRVLAMNKSVVMSSVWVKLYSYLLLVLYCLFCFILYVLFT